MNNDSDGSRLGVLRRFLSIASLAAALLAPVAAWAEPVIESVTGSIQAGAEVVRIDLSEPLSAPPSGFAIQVPARIALDLLGSINGLGRSLVDVNQGNLKSVNVVQAGERTRLVLNLKQATSYTTELRGKSLFVMLQPTAAPAAVPAGGGAVAAANTVFAESRAASVAAIRDIDFRRSADGAGRVVVSLPSNQVGVDVRPLGKGLAIDFLRTSLPEGLRRRLDVADFGTPVQLVTASQSGDRVRLVVDAVGEWEHSAYQTDEQFVLEIRAKKVDITKLTQGPGFTGEKLSLNCQNIEVRSLLQVIADFTNFNIVTSDTVSGALTLRLKDVPWDQALQIIMDARGLGMRKTGTVLWIAPKDEIDARTKKDYEAALAIEKLEPLRTQAFQLNYAKASDMIYQLAGRSGGGGSGSGAASGVTTRFLTERGTAIAEPRTNQLFVTDTAAKIEEVRQLLLKLDVPVRQVLIEARIVEASDTFSRSLGVRLGGGTTSSASGRTRYGSSYENVTTSAGNTYDSSSSFVNLPASSDSGTTVGSFAVSIFNSSATKFLALEVSALEADGKGKIVSSPRVVTADQTKALIEQGTEFPYQQSTSSGATSVAFRKANLKLEVTPQITPEGNIILDLDVNKDSKGETTTQGIAINTKHIKTQVLVENGGTVVIGGIFTLTETEDVTKISYLGDVPVLGNLFKSRSRSVDKSAMLIFITPKMIAERSAAR
ncbi:type IV pilus secretin family protein [Xylophilus sp.]|uniref:type IV pilus secretin family protein n=1 Tax=Xylophilus sp. TaxID=2653893 RepID=UPI0013BC1CC0|nr:type IV pilus secretin family protein [Xylophilus sp.]KAF1044266.1 MAG: Type IV pilus biogenesis and competence protein PilQ [Xylophilus sp.]